MSETLQHQQLTMPQQRIVEVIASGKANSLTHAAELARVSRRTVQRLSQNDTAQREIERLKGKAADKARGIINKGLIRANAELDSPDCDPEYALKAALTGAQVLEKVDDGEQQELQAQHPPEYYRAVIRRGLCRLIPQWQRSHIRNTWRNGELRWQLQATE